MYAVFEVAGNQYRAEVGDKVQVERLDHNVGDKVEFDQVMMVGEGENVLVGQPTVSGAKVVATIAEQSKGERVIVFHYRIGGKRHRAKNGHRQNYTWLQIEDIVGGK
jgi:large subunit ribosomal protein L21